MVIMYANPTAMAMSQELKTALMWRTYRAPAALVRRNAGNPRFSGGTVARGIPSGMVTSSPKRPHPEPDQDREERASHADGARVFLSGSSVEALSDTGVADIPKAIDEAKGKNGFVWLHLVDPDEATINEAREILRIHPIAAADVVSGRQQPKVQKFAEHLFILLWNIMRSDGSKASDASDGTDGTDGTDGVTLGETYLYIGDGWLLTVQRGDGGRLIDLPELVRNAPEELRNGAMPAAYTIMAKVVDGYAKAAADVEADLEELEEQVFTVSTTEDHRRIYEIRKNIGRIDRAVSSIAAALRQSTSHFETLTVGSEHIMPYLLDLLDDAAGTAALINHQSRALDAILSTHENNVSARQNQDMRTISAFAALLALPTLIAGVYGMNFQNLPLVQWEYGWLAVGLGIVIIDIVVYRMFKRRHWL
jgi:magnesium transporter